MLHVARSICDAPRWLGLWAQLPLQVNSPAPATKYTRHPCTKGVRSACTNGETRMSVTPSALHSLVARSTASSRTACSAFFLALLRWMRPFLALKQDERVTTDVSFAACMQRMEPSGQQHIATTNLLRVAAVQTGPEMGCCCIGDWNSGRGGVGRAAFVDGSPSSTTGASV